MGLRERDKPPQGAVASMLKLYRNGALWPHWLVRAQSRGVLHLRTLFVDQEFRATDDVDEQNVADLKF